jgi:ABC-type glycerol-3-phosphate transport system permease component
MRLTSNGFVTAIVVLIAALWSIPTLGLFISSFRPAADIHGSGWWTGIVPPWHFTIENYQHVLAAQGIGHAFLNSLIIAIPGTILPVMVAAFAAYAFAWMKFPARDWIFLAIIALQVVPIQLTLIPILQIYTGIGITGSFLAIWLTQRLACHLPSICCATSLAHCPLTSWSRRGLMALAMCGFSLDCCCHSRYPRSRRWSSSSSCGSGTICWWR